ncbi:MAG: acyl-ACP thioesterase [Clostridiales Family XIII bacterium]|jgi:acyl-ACP thioesterase|nr:acyl-ACP thioesterase [Clostridiales Family XIII bacterium]
MNAVPVYTTEHFITSSDVDFASKLRLSTMFGFFQDIASLHAANLGASVERLRADHGAAWILMRARLEVDKYPMLHDKVTVQTWPQAPRALYERDYAIKDEAGNTMVRAASTWIIMKLETREIIRGKLLDYFNIELNTDRALEKRLGKLHPTEGAVPIYEKPIGYSDIDYNEHINNARYVEYVMDCISVPEHKAKAVRAIEVHYLNEAVPGETIVLRRAEAEGPAGKSLYVDGIGKEGGTQVFGSVIEFE